MGVTGPPGCVAEGHTREGTRLSSTHSQRTNKLLLLYQEAQEDIHLKDACKSHLFVGWRQEHTTAHVWQSKDSVLESVLSSGWGPAAELRLGSECLY